MIPPEFAKDNLLPDKIIASAFLPADLTNILQQVPAAVSILKGSSFIVEMANSKSLEIWGKTNDEVLGRKAFDIFPELISQGFDEILNAVFTTGTRYVANEAPVQLMRQGKLETLYINFSYNPLYNLEGEIIGIISVGSDVTELVYAREGLRESNERLEMAIESAEMGTWDFNPSTNIIICSDRTKELFGFRVGDEVTLQMAIDAIIEEDKERVMKAIENAVDPKSDGNYNIEYSLVNRYDNIIRTIKARGRAFFKENKVHRFIGTALDITAEVQARKSQSKLLALVDNSLELMSVLELDGKNSYINKAGQKMLGFASEKQVLETPISELHTPEDIAFVEANVLPAVMNSGRWSGMMNVRHLQTGEVFPVFNNTIRIDDLKSGKPIAIGAVMRDMRPELATQRILAESESKLRNVIEQAPSPILILKGEDMILEVANQALYDLWQVDESAIGKKFLDILPEMDGQGFLELLQNVYHTRTAHYGYEVPALFDRGNDEQELLYFNFVYQPYKEVTGEVSGVLVMATDVTGQVNAQRKLLKSEATLSLAVQAAQFGVFELDMVSQHITHSPKTAEIFGLNPTKQWPFKTFTDAVHPEDIPIRIKAHEQAKLNGNLFYEVRIFWPDGSLHWMRLNGKVVFQDGVPISSVGTVLDVTNEKKAAEILEEKILLRTNELKLANERLAYSNKQLEQFAHVASHDMKEPVRKIAMFTSRLKPELEEATPAAEFLEKIEKATNRLIQMVEGVLSYASLSSETESRNWIHLSEVVKTIEGDLELVINQKKASIVYNALPDIYGAPFLIYQLFYNLINNSLKFSHPGRNVSVKISASTIKGDTWLGETIISACSYWEIRVEDNGIGFRTEDSEKIFKTFARLHSKDQYEGTGLGLTLCRDIVEKHSGKMKAFGEDGKGATFIILLPIKEK